MEPKIKIAVIVDNIRSFTKFQHLTTDIEFIKVMKIEDIQGYVFRGYIIPDECKFTKELLSGVKSKIR